MPTLSREEARRVYDRIGVRQDSQAFYEDPAVEILLSYGDFASARSVFELGCGTGRFALRLLSEFLPADARYRGIDLSPAMVGLARERLRPFAARAQVLLTDGNLVTPEPDGSGDRFVSNYVLDLLSETDIAAAIGEARRLLVPGGLLCLSGLGTGSSVLSRFVARMWARVQAGRPGLVGGCRPIELLDWLPRNAWRIRHEARVAPFGVPSQIVIAERISAQCGAR